VNSYSVPLGTECLAGAPRGLKEGRKKGGRGVYRTEKKRCHAFYSASRGSHISSQRSSDDRDAELKGYGSAGTGGTVWGSYWEPLQSSRWAKDTKEAKWGRSYRGRTTFLSKFRSPGPSQGERGFNKGNTGAGKTTTGGFISLRPQLLVQFLAEARGLGKFATPRQEKERECLTGKPQSGRARRGVTRSTPNRGDSDEKEQRFSKILLKVAEG